MYMHMTEMYMINYMYVQIVMCTVEYKVCVYVCVCVRVRVRDWPQVDGDRYLANTFSSSM